jgi:drug/metabolite transporter (DMT)-like permease
MKKTIGVGIVCLVAGVLLIVWGYNLSQSVSGQFQRIFTGSPGDKSMWLYIGGSVLCAAGVFQIYLGKQ